MVLAIYKVSMAARIDESVNGLTWSHCAVSELFTAPSAVHPALRRGLDKVLSEDGVVVRNIHVTRRLRVEKASPMQHWLKAALQIAENS